MTQSEHASLSQAEDVKEETFPDSAEVTNHQSNDLDCLGPILNDVSPNMLDESAEPIEAPTSHQQQFDQFVADLEKLENCETKIQCAIQFMESSLAQPKTPRFKNFWEARAICLQLFKENISPIVRGIYWAKYNELSKEARRLKEILDEQSAFAVEQIDIAIKALNDDLSRYEELIQKNGDINFSGICQTLEKELDNYHHIQRQLNLLNAFASRITALRKELIRTDMRIKHKNRFFQLLSTAGDQVFPKRKEFIKEVSSIFSKDVDAFIQAYFNNQSAPESFFYLREEIKGFQNIAKLLTLNTQCFTHTRMRLSECWDKLKIWEKERKKERSQQRELLRQNFEEIEKKIIALNDEFEQNLISHDLLLKKQDELAKEARNLELGREEIHKIREGLHSLRKKAKEKAERKEEEQKKLDLEKEKQRRDRIQSARNDIERLIQDVEKYDVDQLTQVRDELIGKIQNLSISKMEKVELERLLKPIKDAIVEKKECTLLSLSEDDKQTLQKLKEILQERKKRREEIKAVIRKAKGSSGLDFEQAMAHSSQMEEENERLEKINQGIKEVEQKIASLERNVRNLD